MANLLQQISEYFGRPDENMDNIFSMDNICNMDNIFLVWIQGTAPHAMFMAQVP